MSHNISSALDRAAIAWELHKAIKLVSTKSAADKSKSPAQHRLMEAVAHTKGGYGGVPQDVGKEFIAADDSGELPVIKTDIDAQAHKADTSPHTDAEPTQDELENGDYEKARITVAGLPVDIENPYGSIRSGIDNDGNEWEVELQDSYGEFVRTEGADGDGADVFVAPHLDQDELNDIDYVYVVDQIFPDTGGFDEHKVVVGYDNEEEAIEAYLSNYNQGWAGLGAITELPIDLFKLWLEHGDLSEPVSGIDFDAFTETRGQKADRESQ